MQVWRTGIYKVTSSSVVEQLVMMNEVVVDSTCLGPKATEVNQQLGMSSRLSIQHRQPAKAVLTIRKNKSLPIRERCSP